MEPITINNNAQPVDYWQHELETVLDPGWFDTIAKAINDGGGAVPQLTAKRKACYVRCQKASPFAGHLWADWYREDFQESPPAGADGSDWKAFLED